MSKKTRRAQKKGPALAADDSPNHETPDLATFSLSPPMLKNPLLVASLGNPGRTYQNTRHSAGHILLKALADYLSYPPFTRSVPHAVGQISRGQDALFWQSPTLMNISGTAVAATWRRFLRDLDIEEQKRARLVVIHDELESPLGKIKVKKGGSIKGHNGLKSCKQRLPGVDFWRLSVGIGRPASRESDAVAAYVLKAMTMQEREQLTSGVEEAAVELARLSEEK